MQLPIQLDINQAACGSKGSRNVTLLRRLPNAAPLLQWLNKIDNSKE
jgi:hypothetical protein